jgi:hypothetical protein
MGRTAPAGGFDDAGMDARLIFNGSCCWRVWVREVLGTLKKKSLN